MKIAVLIDELISGGFQKVAIMEVIYLKKLGYSADLVVLHRTKNLGYQDIIEENNINVVFLSDRLPALLKFNFRIPLFSFFSFFHIFYPLFIYRFINFKEYDYFISHGTYTILSSVAISKKKGIPYIGYIHDSISYILKQKYKNRTLRYFLPLLMPVANLLDKLIITNSMYVIAFPFMIKQMSSLVRHFDRFVPIYNGCIAGDTKEILHTRESFYIAVTKWDEGKNFELLIKLWSRMPKKPKLRVIGSYYPENLKDKYISLINENGLQSCIEILGAVDEQTLNSYYKRAKVLIHPCREAFGMTILESAAFGCPSVFTSNSGVAELFPEKIRKQLPEEGNLDDYIASISMIENLPTEKYTDLIKDYHLVAKENSWEEHCKKIISLLVSK